METLDSEQVYAGAWLSVREDTVRRPDGSTGVHAVVEASDIALVVAVDGDRLHLVEQYRHPVAARRWELPSGSTDPGLDAGPEAVARRELREETGLAAGRLSRLGTLEISPSTLTQRCHVFLATEAVPGEPQRDPEEQDLRSAWFTRADVEGMIADGSLTDAKSIAAYALLLVHERTGASRGAQPSRASRWRAWSSVVPAGLRWKPPLPGSSMVSQKQPHSGR